MTTSTVAYRRVHAWVKGMLGRTHRTVVSTVAWAVLCLVLTQRVTPAALARALPAEHPGRAHPVDQHSPLLDGTTKESSASTGSAMTAC
ncbi:MAG: hypothetical protein AB7N91_32825 [Candidatus Tectimicrobiota bacterium]